MKKCNELQLEQLCLLVELELGKKIPTKNELNNITERIGLGIGIKQDDISLYKRAVECEIAFELE